MRWGLAIGAWGDTLMCVGVIRAALRRLRQPSCGVIHYGSDPAIAPFLRQQTCFDRAVYIKPRSRAEYGRLSEAMVAGGGAKDGWLPEMLAGTGIAPCDVWVTSLHSRFFDRYRAEYFTEARTSREAEIWARKQVERWRKPGRKVFLLHPQSLQSAQKEAHWPHWEAAIRWMLRETRHTFVLTGLHNPFPLLSERYNPRLINLCGRTTMQQVFALAEASDGVFTTCNSVAHWSVIRRRPVVIALNRDVVNARNYFRRFLDRPPARVVLQSDPLDAFQRAASISLAADQG